MQTLTQDGHSIMEGQQTGHRGKKDGFTECIRD